MHKKNALIRRTVAAPLMTAQMYVPYYFFPWIEVLPTIRYMHDSSISLRRRLLDVEVVRRPSLMREFWTLTSSSVTTHLNWLHSEKGWFVGRFLKRKVADDGLHFFLVKKDRQRESTETSNHQKDPTPSYAVILLDYPLIFFFFSFPELKPSMGHKTASRL